MPAISTASSKYPANAKEKHDMFNTTDGVAVRFGADGQIWTWTNNGQITLANSNDAKQFCLDHFRPKDLEQALQHCRTPKPKEPNT